jgi:hypothetical protein
MSSIEQMNVEQLLEQRKKIDAAINAMGGAKTGKNVEKKQKRKSTPAGPWAAWTTKVLAENKEAVEAFKLAAEKKIGAHLKWISENKGKDSAEYKAFAVEFAVTHPKVSAPAPEASSVVSAEPAPASVTSAPASEAAPKKRGPKKLADMTPEERAAHDKKLTDRRSKKEAEKVAAETVAKAEVAVAAPVAAPVPAPVAAPEPEEAESQSEGEEATLELLPFKLDGVSYFRLGAKSSDGEIEWAGDLWYNKKGVRGTYVGSLEEDGSIDTDAEEPQLE